MSYDSGIALARPYKESVNPFRLSGCTDPWKHIDGGHPDTCRGVRLDPSGCRCTDCIIGWSVPVDKASDRDLDVLAGTTDDASGENWERTTTLTATHPDHSVEDGDQENLQQIIDALLDWRH